MAIPGSVKRELETFSRCAKCDCSWFEEYQVWRVNKHHNVILGQKPPKVDAGPFVFLRCARCREVHAPNIIASTGLNNSIYIQMIAELEEELTPIDENAKLPPVVMIDPVTGQPAPASKQEETSGKDIFSLPPSQQPPVV